MPPPTTDPGSPPASPAPLASTLLASFQRMTSSARILLIGCFQCGFLKAGCWRQQEEHDGAWFDCEKLQVEHPYCYVNPVALADAPSATALCHAPASEDATPTPPRITHPGAPPLKASPQRSPGSSLAPRGTSMPPGAPPPKRHKRSYVNGGLVSERTVQSEAGDGTCTVESSVSMGVKDGVARYTRGHSGRTSLVESFAAKLEADLRRLEYDRQRAEGEVVALGPAADDSDWLTEYSGPKSCSADFLLDPPSGYPYDELEDLPPLRPDVWKPSELENVFECYNMAAFYSYGATCQVGEKFAGSRVRGEKFEEVFPVSPHSNNNNNNNNNYKVLHKATSEGEQNSSMHRIASKDKLTTETAPSEPPAGDGRQRECTEDQLRQLIRACVFAESVSEVDEEMYTLSDKDVYRNDGLFAESASEVGGKNCCGVDKDVHRSNNVFSGSVSEVDNKIGTHIDKDIRRNNSMVTGNVSEVDEKDCSVIGKDVHRKAGLSVGNVSEVGERQRSFSNRDGHRNDGMSAGNVSEVNEKQCSVIHKDVHRKDGLSAGNVSDVGEKQRSVSNRDVHRSNGISVGNVSQVDEENRSVIDKNAHRKDGLSAGNVNDVGEKQRLVSDRDVHRNDGMSAGNVSDAGEKQRLVSDQDSHRNNTTIRFGGKSFNKLLVFDLVKSAMSECSEQYPRSVTLCSTYPVHLVQKKVMKVMLDEDKKAEENLCGLEVFHSPSLSTQRERQVARRLVVGLAADEVKAEDRHWQDFRKEEQEMKDAIVSEVLHDLISDTADVFRLLVAKKLAVSQDPED